MRSSYKNPPRTETASAIETIGRQTRQRLALRAWNAVTVAMLAAYVGASAAVGESPAARWGFAGVGLIVCGAVMLLGRRARHTQAGWLLWGAWLAACTWLGIQHGALQVNALAAIVPILAAASTLGPFTGLLTGALMAVITITLTLLAASGLAPLAAYAGQATDTAPLVAYPALMVVTGVTGWLLARAADEAVDGISTLAQSWEQSQQTLENRAIERSRKVQEANRQLARHAKQIEVSASIARLCSQRTPLDDLMSTAARSLQTQLGLTHVLVYVPSADQRHLMPKAAYGASGSAGTDRLAQPRLNDDSAPSRAFTTGEPVVVADGENGAGAAPGANLAGARSWAAFPLLHIGRPVGVLELVSDQTGSFDGALVAVIDTVACSLASALAGENQPLATGSGLELDSSFAAQLEELAEADSRADVGRILVAAVAAAPAVYARLLLIERDVAGVEWIVMRESWAQGERPIEPIGTRLRLEDTPWAPFLSPSDPIVVEDIQTDRRANEAALIAARVAGVNSLISIPLTTAAGWIGAWLVGRAEPSAFEPALVRRYLALGRAAAITLDNLRLRADVRRQQQHERLRAAIARPLASPFETGELLEDTVQAVGRILGVPRVAVHIAPAREELDGN